MLNVLVIITAVATLSISLYGLITGHHESSTYMMLSLSMMILFMGIQEFQRNRKILGCLCICVFLLTLYVFITEAFL